LDGRINLATFSDQRRFSPDVAALLEHTVLSQTSAISGRFDAMHVDVSVTLVDGTQTRRRCAAPLGSWSRPIEPIVIEAKAHDLLDGLLDEQRANAFWSAMAMPTDVLRISDLMPGLA
jgi:aconitate decarboxylase